MAFIVRIAVSLDAVPHLEPLAEAAANRLETDVRLDEESLLLEQRGERLSSWCPWPRPAVGLYVPLASTRGAELSVQAVGTGAELRVAIPVLASWTDWELGITLAGLLSEGIDAGAQIQGEGSFLTEGLGRHFIDDDARYIAELEAGLASLEKAISLGRVVRIGGPAGFAVLGPMSWQKIVEGGPPEEAVLRAVEHIQASIEVRGFEHYHQANPLVLEGRLGREVIAAVLPPEQDTVLRDPEYVLLSGNLEQAADAELLLLPFEHIEDALPGVAVWLDDATCAISAIPRADWERLLARIRPLLTPTEDLLDGGRTPVPTRRPRQTFAPQHPDSSSPEAGVPIATGPRVWWKFW